MKVKTFFSEIDMDDLDDQINKFLHDGNYKFTEIKRTGRNNGGVMDFSAQVQYESVLFLEIGDICRDYIKNLN
jgi:hypothetical protein